MSTALKYLPSTTECAICRAPGPETFSYMGERYIFDIDLARTFVQDGRETLELDLDDVRFSLEKCRLDNAHIQHVDISYPGIIAYVWHTAADGTTVCGQRLVDGHHRAARCLDLGVPFFVHLLTEEESQAILQRGPEPAMSPAAGNLADARQHNRAAWNNRVTRKQRFTQPASAEYLARRNRPSRWMGQSIAGKRLLLLGAGGGRQSVRYASFGAIVTVVDISDEMLELDRIVCAERGYDVRLIQASMDDLSLLEPASFDIVNQPVSTCYVPDVVAAYREVARVTVPGGLYISQHKQPASLQCSVQPSARGYELTEPYYRTGPLPPVVGSPHREEGTVEFLHRWEELIGGLCRSGFVVEDLEEPKHAKSDARRGSFADRSRYVAPYVRIKARRIAG